MCADVRDRFCSHRVKNALCSAGCGGRWGSPRATLVQPAAGWKGIRDVDARTSPLGSRKSRLPCRELLFAAPTQTHSMQPPAPNMIIATRRIRMIVAGDMPVDAGCGGAYCACG